MMLAPFDNEEYEIWALGNRMDALKGKRVTRIYEIHDDLSQHGSDYPERLVSLGIPMVVGEEFPLKADHVKTFNFKRSEELYGALYLTSSTAYMASDALSEGATHISFYGSDMAVDDFEYFWQRPCLEAWIGFAKGRGIGVFLPEVCPIGKCEYIEGRKCGGKPDFKIPPFTQDDFLEAANLHKQSMAQIEEQIRQLQNDLNAHSGGVQVYERLAKVSRAVESGQSIKKLSDTYRIKNGDSGSNQGPGGK